MREKANRLRLKKSFFLPKKYRQKRKIRAEMETETRCFFQGDLPLSSRLKNFFKKFL